MGFLQDKNILITGMISERSIAYSIAEACHREGANLAFTYVVDKLADRVKRLADNFESDLVYRLDVQNDTEIDDVFQQLGTQWQNLHGLVHAIAFAPREALTGGFLENTSREAYRTAHDISAYSLTALARAAYPMMKNCDASMVALTYLGAVRAIPNYNVMGTAKAALEATIRYIAADVGKDGIRCNGISAGPIKTLAAAGISGFSKVLHIAANNPLQRNVNASEVGNVAAFLLSNLSSAITGSITYADCGYHIQALDVDLK